MRIIMKIIKIRWYNKSVNWCDLKTLLESPTRTSKNKNGQEITLFANPNNK